MSVVIVYGEQGSGKSQLVQPLCRLYGLAHVVEEWDGHSPSATRLSDIPGGCLAVTNQPVDVVPGPGMTYLNVQEAAALANQVKPAA